MEILQEFITTYGVTILYTIFTAVASFVGLKVKALYEEIVNTERKERVVKNVVNAVEQLYHDLDGSKKLEKAKESIIILLNEKGLSITDLEMDILIESACNSFKQSQNENVSQKTIE